MGFIFEKNFPPWVVFFRDFSKSISVNLPNLPSSILLEALSKFSWRFFSEILPALYLEIALLLKCLQEFSRANLQKYILKWFQALVFSRSSYEEFFDCIFENLIRKFSRSSNINYPRNYVLRNTFRNSFENFSLKNSYKKSKAVRFNSSSKSTFRIFGFFFQEFLRKFL